MRTNAELQVLFLCLQFPSGEPAQFLAEFHGSAVNGGETGDGKLAGIGSSVTGVRVVRGVKARADVDEIGSDAEGVGDDLGGGRFVTLSLRHRAHADDDLAVDVQLDDANFGLAGEGSVGIDDARLTEIVGAGIESRADAEANPTAFFASRRLLFLPVVPADQLFRR